MKKIIIFLLLITFIFTGSNQIFAYENFEWFEKVGNDELLKEFTESDYQNYYDKVKRKMFDWSIYEVNSGIKIKFISETLFHYYNNGDSSINYKYKSESETIDSLSFKVSGGLKLETQKNTKIFGDGLNATMQSNYELNQKQTKKETFDVNVEVKPGNQLLLYMYGEGRVINGVAKKYLFFFETNKGGYEIFSISTHYQKLEVSPI